VDAKVDAAHCGRCDHDCTGGACSDGRCVAYTVTPSQQGVRGLLVAGERLYWTRGVVGPSQAGVFSSKLDGTDVIAVRDSGSGVCTRLATAMGKPYFICVTGGQYEIRQCTLPCAAGSSTTLTGAIDSAGALATDPATGTLYYATFTPRNQAPTGSIFDIAGNRIGDVDQANPVDVAVSNGSIFWLNAGTYSSDAAQRNGGVKRASLTSPTVELGVVGAGGMYFDNSSLAVDANNVYFAGRDGVNTSIVTANATATGSLPTTFANVVGEHVVSDGTNVFFDEPATSSIRYCSRGAGCGTGKTLLAEYETQLNVIVLDDDSVLWAKSTGEIRRIAKP
jgi:hypothetical protein